MIKMIPAHTATEDIRELYEDTFPHEEKRNWSRQLQLMAAGKLQLLRLHDDNDVFAGFIFYWNLHDFIFIEYFAIHPAMRGGGMGSQIMQQLDEQFTHIVLEVEPPITETAIRRIVFYERLGYITFPQIYHQPPHHDGYPPLELRLMQKGLVMDEKAFSRIKERLYCEVYNIKEQG
ncbi:MAG TPA: GNAT family N-acetyltransferase [Chitinophaga sp.]|uniref:GNAT family N-acetyltransferase n=1 Tax=Chitinophaga sp. TaxID=1869181 RepID=UPI002C54BAB9|nr:GNAT family N-acetyltransferase [Chitinophaga sp.]HVI43632.1 GNAT family N-acetyltransferase [Chitinophaga sp.]